jgi:flagellar hook assembly protein FlgD
LTAYPNPFNPSTQIRFAMQDEGLAALRVYNLNGQIVRELVHEQRAAGEYTVSWDGRDNRGVVTASGVYFIRLETGNQVKLSKVTLVR